MQFFLLSQRLMLIFQKSFYRFVCFSELFNLLSWRKFFTLIIFFSVIIYFIKSSKFFFFKLAIELQFNFMSSFYKFKKYAALIIFPINLKLNNRKKFEANNTDQRENTKYCFPFWYKSSILCGLFNFVFFI